MQRRRRTYDNNYSVIVLVVGVERRGPTEAGLTKGLQDIWEYSDRVLVPYEAG